MPVAPDGSPLPYVAGGGIPLERISIDGSSAPSLDDQIRQLVESATQILGADGLDDVEKQFIAQVATMAQKLLATRQKERDGLMSGQATPSALRTALG